MSNRAEETNGPEDVDAAFEAIVAGLRREGSAPEWPESPEAAAKAAESPEATEAERTPRPDRAATVEKDAPPSRPAAPPEEDEGHYEPPEPPPLPPLRRTTVASLALIVLGVLLFFVHGLLGMLWSTAFPLGLLLISGGIGWLVVNMRKGPPPDSGWDDGAQV
ncbi:hypothetical protein [Crossiella cryophila]|uniref:DUF308 domain-containing protein n=1 Tax=Crossiella cryophila TaxID=43355 RepID=A0A7W7C8Z7_9PSEU|nr:hypothetical protein [Crossiella cryophila]MBB4676695.1 hypothetical protein [Crossiella cryophila]